MLYLDSVSIHNFKSFRHANLKLLKGFNCIVGPNGSGKSNICDSILFALGESSLKRLRVSNSSQLIHGSAKLRKDGVRKAYVKLAFTGDRNFEISRHIKSNGKIGYKIDGKNATRHDVIDALRAYRCAVDETNVIAQGEISYMQSLSPKDRRELIDVASGIREFDEKKAISLKELEKVDARGREAQIELGLKKGFLSDIEKQKNDAESYLALKDQISRGTYTLLKARESEISRNYDGSIAEIKAGEERIAKINENLLKLESTISTMSAEKATHSKQLNEKSIEVSSTNRKLEEIEKERAVKETESRSIKDRIKERETETGVQLKELESLKTKTKKASEEEGRIKITLKEKEAEVGSTKLDSLMNSENGANELLDLYNQNQTLADSLHNKHSEISSNVVRTGAAIESIAKELDELQSSSSSSSSDSKELTKKIEGLKGNLDSVSKSKKTAKESIDKHFQNMTLQKKEAEKLDSKALELRGQLAMSGASLEGRIEEELKKTIGKGFYGASHTLCTYEEKYDAAVNSAAGARLNYFIVESKDVAEKAISVLKLRQLGRASFIPLDFISSHEEKSTTRDLLINHVSFDPKYENAFRYIFSNTCIVSSIAEIKKSELSKNRFVTYDGELVEQSGVISGGAQRRHMSASSIQSRLRSIEEEREQSYNLIQKMEEESNSIRSKLSELEASEMNVSFELKRAIDQFETLQVSIKDMSSKAKSLSDTLSIKRKELLASEAETKKLSTEINRIKDLNESILRQSKSGARPKESKEKELSKYKTSMHEIENIKVQLATTIKEREMDLKRSGQIESAITILKEQSMSDMGKLAQLDSEITELSKAKSELQDEIKSHGARYGSLMSKMEALDQLMAKASMEKGRAGGEMTRAERDLNELNMKRAQLQTRLADIRAELASYPKTEPLVGEEIGQIEQKISRSKIQLEALGNVNLKAPEVYGEKKLEVEKAEEKLGVLTSEKESILSMIKEIDSKKLSVFKETFEQVNGHFRKLHSYVFDTDAYMQLDNPKDPLNSGLNIVITEGRNKDRVIEQFSGGEKTLLILMLIFSIQMRNPLSFYLFDEIDTSLDKENVKKLSKLVGELSKTSQMIVVSHNDTMITAADSAIGVIRKSGDSTAMGLQIGSGAKVGA